MKTLRTPIFCATLFIISFYLFPRAGAAELPSIMRDIVTLRAELEAQSRDQDLIQKDRRDEQDLWTQKRLELEGVLQRETLRRVQLEEKLRRHTNRVIHETKVDPGARRELSLWIKRAERWIESSIPFRREQRLQSLLNLKKRVERKMESLESLSAELWLFYESELKMAADNEFRISEVVTPNGPQKAEIARLGLVALFARTPDGSVYQSIVDNGRWDLKILNGESKENALRLIENLKAKKDSGLYFLPLSAAPGSTTPGPTALGSTHPSQPTAKILGSSEKETL